MSNTSHPPQLNFREETPYRYRDIKKAIIDTFPNPLIRLYCFLRFLIIPIRMMDSIGQYINSKGAVLDLGCGFGLFTLFFARNYPGAHFIGVDLSEKRINDARRSAKLLGLQNVEFMVGDAVDLAAKFTESFQTVISIDLLHHLSFERGDGLVQTIYRKLLGPGGIWILKDVTTRPRLMLYFTFLLDLLMNPRDSFYYRNLSVWRKLCCSLGFITVDVHEVWDILPYPHFILVARKGENNDGTVA